MKRKPANLPLIQEVLKEAFDDFMVVPPPPREPVTFTVFGVAQPKGSTRVFVAKGKHPHITHSNPRTMPWQHLIAGEAQRVSGDGLFVGAVAMRLAFHLPRPQSLPKRVVHNTKAPDLDKLVRCALDALTGILYGDDSQVVELHATKVYACQGTAPHVTITVDSASPPPPVAAPGSFWAP